MKDVKISQCLNCGLEISESELNLYLNGEYVCCNNADIRTLNNYELEEN